MGTDEGFAILKRAADAATTRYVTDYQHHRLPRQVDGLGDVARKLQRAIDAAGAELLALGLNGVEAELVISAWMNGLIPPPYPMEDEHDH